MTLQLIFRQVKKKTVWYTVIIFKDILCYQNSTAKLESFWFDNENPQEFGELVDCRGVKKQNETQRQNWWVNEKVLKEVEVEYVE